MKRLVLLALVVLGAAAGVGRAWQGCCHVRLLVARGRLPYELVRISEHGLDRRERDDEVLDRR